MKKLDKLTDVELAKAGLFIDDPYGDGIRLESIREPSEARQAALRIVNNEAQFHDVELVREEYIPKLRKWTLPSGHFIADFVRNCDL